VAILAGRKRSGPDLLMVSLKFTVSSCCMTAAEAGPGSILAWARIIKRIKQDGNLFPLRKLHSQTSEFNKSGSS